jgi:hypothetical protein
VRRPCSAISKRVANDQLRVRINGDPCPHVASALGHLLRCHVLLLCVNELPDFIALNPLNAQMANMGIVVSSAGAAKVFQQFQNRMLRNPRNSAGCIYRVPFYKCGNDLRLAGCIKAIHMRWDQLYIFNLT